MFICIFLFECHVIGSHTFYVNERDHELHPHPSCVISARCSFIWKLTSSRAYVLFLHHFCYALHPAQWGLKLIYSTANRMLWQQPHVPLIGGVSCWQDMLLLMIKKLNCSQGCSTTIRTSTKIIQNKQHSKEYMLAFKIWSEDGLVLFQKDVLVTRSRRKFCRISMLR